MIERLFTFAKAQVSSLFGGLVDYLAMILVTESLGIHYTLSIAISGMVGAVVNFSINQKWTFQSKGSLYQYSFWMQLLRFVFVVINSIILKASGTFLITNFLGIDYRYSHILTDLTVSLAFNYMLQRNWVFKKKSRSNEMRKQTEQIVTQTKRKVLWVERALANSVRD